MRAGRERAKNMIKIDNVQMKDKISLGMDFFSS